MVVVVDFVVVVVSLVVVVVALVVVVPVFVVVVTDVFFCFSKFRLKLVKSGYVSQVSQVS